MTAAEHPRMPLVECAPWCEYGDGHPNCFGRSDQACWSPSEYVSFSLMPVHHEGSDDFPQQIGVMVRREPDTAGAVYLHLNDIKLWDGIPWPHNFLDLSLNLTPDEAKQLGNALIREAELLQSNGTGGHRSASE
ncbi:MAG: hypothetical protein QOH60_2149 [Mycobacterium sp.]|jgi:hypothetical protein|nr:hypothetical protein [Mycobacterium sp.]